MTIKKVRRRHVVTGTPVHRTRVCGITLLAALCVYVVYQMTSSSSDSWYSDTPDGSSGAGGRCPAAEFVVSLARHATPDKVSSYSFSGIYHAALRQMPMQSCPLAVALSRYSKTHQYFFGIP